MKEYSSLATISILLVLLTDHFIGTKLWKKRTFWIFQTIIIVLTVLVDSVSSGLPIVFFNAEAISNWRIGEVPVANLGMAFSLMTVNLILFEWHLEKSNHEH